MTMLNHVRTLILNTDSTQAYPPDYPGEEHCPPGYAKKSLRGPLGRFRTLLFGPVPDRALLNLRLLQFMTLLHGSELAGALVLDDTRITYLPLDDDSFVNLWLAGPRVTRLTGTAEGIASRQGDFRRDDKLSWSWRLTADSGTQATIKWADETGTETTKVLTYSASSLTGPVLLPGSTTAFTFVSTTGASWLIEDLARPASGLADIARRTDDISAEMEEELFAGGLDDANLRSRHRDHPELLERLAARLIALARRTAEA
jgi:hypothetical protein